MDKLSGTLAIIALIAASVTCLLTGHPSFALAWSLLAGLAVGFAI